MFKKLLAISAGALGAFGIGLPRVKANNIRPLTYLNTDVLPVTIDANADTLFACNNTSVTGISPIAITGQIHSAGYGFAIHGITRGTGGSYALYGEAPPSSSSYALGTDGASEFGGNIVPKGSGLNIGSIRSRWESVHTGAVYTDLLNTNEAKIANLTTSSPSVFGGNIYPTVDNKFTLGGPDFRWWSVSAHDVVADVFHGILASNSLSKFKENIETPSDINYLSAIPDPIYFNWKHGENKKRQLGFMGDYLPSIARDDEGAVYINSVVAILCGAVQQLKKENEELRKMIQGN